MITVISGTNRPNSQTAVVAKYYAEVLAKATKEEVKYLSLERLNDLEVKKAMYSADDQCATIQSLQDEFVLPANKFVIVSPEYNGSFPGILKYFIDAVSIRDYQGNFKNKQALLVGVASGRAGNLRGMGHLTDVLMHVGIHVNPKQLPISSVDGLVKDGVLADAGTKEAIDQQIAGFLG